MLKTLALPCAILALSAVPAFADVVEKTVEYDLPNGETAKGVAIYDEDMIDDADDLPGVLVIPEWWGLTEYPKMRARELAEQGYITFVADMYGDGKTTEDPSQAGQWSGQAGQFGLDKLAKPALEQLKNLKGVDDERLAAIGFCFGGSTVVAMAGGEGADELKAVVSFHGGLAAEAAPKGESYEGPAMLILHGGADPMDTPEAFGGFVQNSLKAGVPLTVVSFPGALHAFSNPDADDLAEANPQMQGVIAYDEQAAEASIEIMGDFFEMVLDYDDDHYEDHDHEGHDD